MKNKKQFYIYSYSLYIYVRCDIILIIVISIIQSPPPLFRQGLVVERALRLTLCLYIHFYVCIYMCYARR